MLASVIHQHESVIGVHMSHPSHPSRLSQSPALRSLSHTANSRWLSLSHVVVCVSVPRSALHSSHPLLCPVCPPACSLSVLPALQLLLLQEAQRMAGGVLKASQQKCHLVWVPRLVFTKWKEREGYISRVALYAKRHIMMGNWVKGDYYNFWW